MTFRLAIHHPTCCCWIGTPFALNGFVSLSTFVRSLYKRTEKVWEESLLVTMPYVSIYLVKKYRTSRLDDLSDEILLIILDYLPLVDVLRAFYSNNLSDRFHRLILEYRTEFVLWNLCYSDFRYLVDHIFPQSEILKLSLSNFYIPCLIEHFSSLHQELSLIELRELQLDKCTFISPSLLTWISKQLKLKKFHCDYFSYKDSPLTFTTKSFTRCFLQ